MPGILSLSHITKAFGSLHVIKDVSIEINKGEFLTLLGPSGCGKTTLLRIIAGLERADTGSVVLNGRDVAGFEPEKRDVNTVFQSYALFPHMNVFDNIAYGPKLRRRAKGEIKEAVGRMLELVRMEGYERRTPDKLSGGQRQRVAIARAIINNPEILLLDEPLGALDLKLRQHMQGELKRIQRETGVTFIYVTHDQEEALNMSDRIAVMNEGVLEHVGAPAEVYGRPRTLFTASFVGDRNIFQVQGGMFAGYLLPNTRDGMLTVLTDKVRLSREPFYEKCLAGIVTDYRCAGSFARAEVLVGGEHVVKAAEYGSDIGFERGAAVYVSWDGADGVYVDE